MRKQFHRPLTILMAFLILLSSVGFRFVEHQCMMRGKSMAMIAKKDGDSCGKKLVSSCCAASKQKSGSTTFLKKTDCCKETQKFEKLDVAPSSVNKLLSKSLNFSAGWILWSVQSFQFLRSHWNNTSDEDHLRPHTFSSRLHGKSMLFFVQSFLI